MVMVNSAKEPSDGDKLAAVYNGSPRTHGTHGTMLGLLKQCFCCSLHTGAIITGIYATASYHFSHISPKSVSRTLKNLYDEHFDDCTRN